MGSRPGMLRARCRKGASPRGMPEFSKKVGCGSAMGRGSGAMGNLRTDTLPDFGSCGVNGDGDGVGGCDAGQTEVWVLWRVSVYDFVTKRGGLTWK